MAIAGNDVWKNERVLSRATKTVTVAGEKWPLVTIQAEAFGWLMIQNCYPKWQHTVPRIAKNQIIPPLKKDSIETHKFHATVWSDAKKGKDQGGGWDQAAYPVYADYLKTIEAMRKQDAKNKHAIHEMALQLVRAEHGMTDNDFVPSKGSKKRKREPKQELAPMDSNFELPDVEDHFSVHSEDTSGENPPDFDEGDDAGPNAI